MDRESFEPERLLTTWFATTREDPDRIAERKGWWFGPDTERDRALKVHFAGACEEARAGQLEQLADTPKGSLALILLLDQLPRNLFRGSAQAFSSDERALELCLEGHRTGLDQFLAPIERVFFWMPLQHAEDLERQALGVQLFTGLAAEDPERDALWSEFAAYAELHHDIIQRFGRFPHRNAALGRTTTDRESAWLEEDGERFGQ